MIFYKQQNFFNFFNRQHGVSLLLWLAFPALLLPGCTTVSPQAAKVSKKDLAKNYLQGVNKFDGINQEEALVLAQNELLFHGYESSFDINHPQIFPRGDTNWEIRFLPFNKTMTEVLNNRTLAVLINKKDGQITVDKHF